MTQGKVDASSVGTSTPAATKRTRRPKDRRDTIQKVAADLFAEKGYAATGIGDIVERVGVTPGAIYRHFSSKEDILRSIMSECMDAFIGASGTEKVSVADDSPAASRLIGPIRSAVALTQSQSAQVAITLREWYSLSEDTRQELRPRRRELAQRWENALRGANPDLSPTDAKARRRSLNGALAYLARRRTSVAPSRVEELFTDSLLALFLAPIVHAPTLDEPARHADWSPPRSRRREIRDVGATLFRMYGYQGVGIDEIGKTAGLSGPTVYGTYSSKADILVDACDHAAATIEVALDQALRSAHSAKDALIQVVRSYATAVFDNADVIAVLSRESIALPEGDRARIGRRRSDIRQICNAVLMQVRPDLDDDEATLLFGAAINAMQEIGLLQHGRPQADTASDLVLAFLLAERIIEPAGGRTRLRAPRDAVRAAD